MKSGKPSETAQNATIPTCIGNDNHVFFLGFRSYRFFIDRTSVELVVSVVLAIFFAGFSEITGLNKALFDCDVHNILFKCVIPNSRFFGVSLLFRKLNCFNWKGLFSGCLYHRPHAFNRLHCDDHLQFGLVNPPKSKQTGEHSQRMPETR